jgi:hypothetical protein
MKNAAITIHSSGWLTAPADFSRYAVIKGIINAL